MKTLFRLFILCLCVTPKSLLAQKGESWGNIKLMVSKVEAVKVSPKLIVTADKVGGLNEEVELRKKFLSGFPIVKTKLIPPAGSAVFQWPEDGYILAQGYGMSNFALSGLYNGSGHNGIDISGGMLSPVKIAADGMVAAKGERNCPNFTEFDCGGGYGNWVAIYHTKTELITLYAHLSEQSKAKVGDKVKTGEVIGFEGSSGRSFGPHLHFSVFSFFIVYKDPRSFLQSISYYDTLDPLDYLAPAE